MRIPKEFQPLADQAKAAGWTIETTANTHLKWTSPEGSTVISGTSPSDYRSADALTADLRRAGLAVNGRPASIPIPVLPPPRQPEQQPQPEQRASAAEADELRALVTEARQAMKDLRQETAAARKLLAGDIRELVSDELFRVLDEDGGVLQSFHTVMDAMAKAGNKRLDEFEQTSDRFFRQVNTAIEKRYVALDRMCGEAETLLFALRPMEKAAAGSTPVPAAFRARS